MRHTLALTIYPSLFLALVGCQQRGDASPPCDPTPDSLQTAAVRLHPGAYDLELIETSGPRAGDSARVLLTLREARATDRSPRTEQTPAAWDRQIGISLWGWIDGDLSQLGIPLPEPAHGYIPQPNSQDPLFPGVVVVAADSASGSKQSSASLWVATGLNVRVDLGHGVMDGPGIVMEVRDFAPRQFRGNWGPAGLLRIGGYFCAVQVVPAGG